MTLYEEVLATGGYIANHESDLYIEVNDVNREILKRHPLQNSNKTAFRNEVTGKPCWDVPFAYDPWWRNRGKLAQTLADVSLHQAIAKRGWTSRKENDDQRRAIYDAEGKRLGSFDAAEAWAFLKATTLPTEAPPTPVILHELTELIHVEAEEGPWALYIFNIEGPEGYEHGGKQWFDREIKYPDEEISIAAAKQQADAAMAAGYEVRITDGGDNLVFHFDPVARRIVHGEKFWDTIAHT